MTTGHDLRFATRMLFKDRVSSLIAVVVLALGIGVNGTLFTIVNAFCLRGLPIDSPEQVLFLGSRDARQQERGLSWAEYQDVQTSIRALEGVAALTNAPVALGDERQAAARFMSTFITANALGILREAPAIGRGFTAEDDRPGAAPVVLISHGVWQERFGGDPRITGHTVRVNGTPATVVGVMREGYRFPNNADVWQPLAQLPSIAKASRDARTLSVFGRLQPVSTQAQAIAEVDLLTATLSREYPQTNTGIRITAVPINEQFNGRITDASWMAFMTVGVLSLLIACANVANLLLARSVRRAPEMAVRSSLGGSRWQIVRQLLSESFVLAATGGLLGVGLSVLGTRLFAAAQPADALPYWIQFTFDWRVMAVVLVSVVTSVMLFGLVPALYVSRRNLASGLLEGGRSGMTTRHTSRWTALFLTLEFGLTLLLLCHVGLTVRNFRALQQADGVVSADNLLTFWLSLPPQKYRTTQDRVALQDTMRDRFAQIPGLVSVATTSALPFGGARRACSCWKARRRSSRHRRSGRSSLTSAISTHSVFQSFRAER